MSIHRDDSSGKHDSLTRHPSLQPLSRHHHHALVLAQRLIKQSQPMDVLKADLQTFWDNGGRLHFREEEEYLLPEYAKYRCIEVPAIQEMLLEHVRIRSLASEIAAGAGKDKLLMLGELLRNHVRKEERVIFPMMEEGIPDEQLRKLEPWFSEHTEASVFHGNA